MEELLVRLVSNSRAGTIPIPCVIKCLAHKEFKLCIEFNRYGQLSGMVEPLAGLFGTVAVVVS